MTDILSVEQRDALTLMVEQWIREGFTTPPYTDAQYDIFEWLGLARPQEPGWDYDTVRPIRHGIEFRADVCEIRDNTFEHARPLSSYRIEVALRERSEAGYDTDPYYATAWQGARLVATQFGSVPGIAFQKAWLVVQQDREAERVTGNV